MNINGESAKVKPCQAIYIPSNSTQYIHNPGKVDLIFICIVDPAWRKQDEEVL
jgi:mannose-6-phosphate isomerase-like protein (cupin superfamily)